MNRMEQIQVEKEKKRYAKLCTKRASDSLQLVFIVALYKAFGFRKQRLLRAFDAITKEAEILASGMIGFDDYKAYAEELTGITFEDYFL